VLHLARGRPVGRAAAGPVARPTSARRLGHLTAGGGAVGAVVHHAASLGVAATIRRRLVKELAAGPTDPPLPGDPAEVARWLESVEAAVERQVEAGAPLTGTQVAAAEPRLRTAFLPRTGKSYDVRRAVTTQVLTLMAAEGRLVRGQPRGSWTSRQHTWEPGSAWWPDGVPPMAADEARRRLVEAYLRRFGPATEADVAWWTGWPLGVTRAALTGAAAVGRDGLLLLPDDTDPVDVPAPEVALLPALDPTPMGWKQREFFLPEDAGPLYDGFGNVGPTVWWGGEVVGGWAVRKDGTVATSLLVDRGREVARAVEAAAARLGDRLDGAVVAPSFRTPLERALSGV
jgi:hypothetical protein